MAEPKRVALLLAAGLGTRLRPLTDRLPKCLAPIAGRPLLELWLLMLTRAGFTRIVINTHHLSSIVERYVCESPFRDVITLSHEDYLLGTAGTMLKHRRLWHDGPVLVAHADNFTVFDPAIFLQAHLDRPPGCAMTMMTFETDDPASCGILDLDTQSVVRTMFEKVPNQSGKLANAAVYVIEPEILDCIAAYHREIVDFSTEVIPAFMGRIYAAHNSGIHRDIGTIENLRLAQSEYQWSSPMPASNDVWQTMLSKDDSALEKTIRTVLGGTGAGL